MKLAFSGGATSREWRGSWIPGHLRRRVLAAVLAGAAVLLALSSPPRSAASPARGGAKAPSASLLSGLHAGQVAAPIRLVDPGIAPLLRAGMTVAVLAAPESPDGSAAATQTLARVVAQDVRVLAVAAPSSADTSVGTLVVLAVSRSDALALAGAEAGGRLSVTLGSG